jgi:protein TonB
MRSESDRLRSDRTELPLSLLLGVGAAVGLFLVMALAQKVGRVEPHASAIDETVMAFDPPEVVELEEEPPPALEEPPELEPEPPRISLDQLEIALSPGTGGSLAGDFALPTIAIDARSLGDEFVDFSALDQTPRPIGVTGFDFPRRLLTRKVSGRIVLLLELNAEGRVLDARVDSSDLPDFDDFVVGQVKRWRFTPPTQQGRAVQARARLPIPIHVN